MPADYPDLLDFRTWREKKQHPDSHIARRRLGLNYSQLDAGLPSSHPMRRTGRELQVSMWQLHFYRTEFMPPTADVQLRDFYDTARSLQGHRGTPVTSAFCSALLMLNPSLRT